ncbi:MAG TPA: sigma-70 family RNA polymerase sigma factor [Baekduia sp.]|uniref:sigma-70 family RNA polymerase sigma factor n=1 Tax=Baekduia sp. TaxID=2600305 RepID=UPI002D776A57|nr:sigma-70 family RNA polymerase sigma factor [Baekduia sp.]HET6509144.1 sigma-70 family RNA polymerase sigma factor [Baekduia sp.]
MSRGAAQAAASAGGARSLARAADGRIANGLRAGDPGALEAVRDRCGATVFSYLCHVLRDHAAAEDVFQHVFTEVWQRGAAYDERRGSLMAWVLTIARSRAIDELRRRHPEPVDLATAPEPSVAAPQDAAIDRWRMAHHLARLPAEERELLQLRFYAELSQTEIAARTDLPLGTVKSRMVRGLERLRDLLDEEGLQ